MDARFSELCNLTKSTYDLEFQSLHQKINSYEAEVNSLQAELDRVKTRKNEIELALSSQSACIQDEGVGYGTFSCQE